ncbi:Activator of 90 kDa heat shock protein ATPase-like protein 1 [Hypsibius exemplaris]|uniref:Activator of 90 kDa heat shock protein ATPase-like protein 1 n=1 Tax=Hypsibius exemplaris TaxID=2072580 RepID=A0A9X6NK27_HYPEX|nr:Activator of 90 kDa heat shock protein ATPase-like protein 1 [Hypsibius exemplaris]
MAKWGEGDPRWIVEERPDATNVNNWHWTEKNATEWSKSRFQALFEKSTVDGAGGKCEITKVSEMTGEAYVNNRKSKLIFFYEWVLELEWTGKIEGDEDEYSGKIKIPNFSEEFTIKEVDFEVSASGSTKGDKQLKELLKGHVPVLRAKLETYLKELKEEYSKDLILPTKSGDELTDSAKVPAKSSTSLTSGSAALSAAENGAAPKQPTVGVRIATENLHLTEEFHCTAEDIYRAFTLKEMVQAFTRSNVVLEAEKGGKFSLFNGMVEGSFVELEKNKKIVQRWRFTSWPAAHYSLVTLRFDQTESGTMITMDQTGIPSNDFIRTKDGWKRYYWDSLKVTFGFGAMLS